MSHPIEGKTILVTGANRGIGRSFVEVFLENGAAKAYAAVRSLENALPLVEQFGGRVVPLELDLVDEESIAEAARMASDVDVVINNGGVLTTTQPLAEEAFDSLDFEIDVNVKGLVRMARAFAPVLEANGGGVFGQLNSLASLKAFAGFSTYSASKAAAYSLTQSLRETLGERGIRVISIHPGPIATDMGSTAGLDDIAEPPELVPRATLAAIESGDFHVFPDTMARKVGEAYQSFASSIVEQDLMEE